MNYSPQIYPPHLEKARLSDKKSGIQLRNRMPNHMFINSLSYFLLSERITVKVSKVSMNSFSSAAI